jgi:O-antigen biosynthesis protein
LPSLPEWYLIIAALAALSSLGAVWQPMLLFLPLLGLAVGVLLFEAVMAAIRASFRTVPRTRLARLRLRSITALLYVLQPLARLWGRVKHGLTPWRRRGRSGVCVPRARSWTIWSERAQPPEEWLGAIEAALRENGATILRGGSYDTWDLEVRGGALCSARIRALIEEHGGGRQLVRLRSYPRWSRVGFGAAALFALLSVAAELERAWPAWLVLLSLAAVLVLRELQEYAGATAEVVRAVEERTAHHAEMPRALHQVAAGR